ncbi:hypothetical protein [Tateyamaria pelophila]|uniref:hypothetical protein n=1 Tax=Tateyamaria pelophila TaxID=328415 RepID=UPI001CBCBCB6|nr:hypothetical protein [Tateyamaria pelophila]
MMSALENVDGLKIVTVVEHRDAGTSKKVVSEELEPGAKFFQDLPKSFNTGTGFPD